MNKKFPIKILICLLVCALVAASFTGCKKKSSKSSNGGFVPDYDNYNTYAFFGVDSRSDDSAWKDGEDTTGTEGAPSSDVIMLIRIDKDNDDIKVTSVYRDTMLDVTGAGDLDKCNAAYRDGGAYGSIDMLERDLDIRITGYATADFIAVAEAIDLLGGITVDVEQEKLKEAYKDKGNDSIDVINTYIDELNAVYHRNSPHLTSGGKQVLDGIQSVAYSRLRYTAGSDMRRTVRQRDIMTLMVAKLKEADSAKQREVLRSLYPSIDTDMSEKELMDLFDTLIGFDLGDMQGFPYYKKAKLIKKVWYVIPCDLETNVVELHKRMYGEDKYQSNDDVSELSSQIEEESGLTKEDADEEISDKF